MPVRVRYVLRSSAAQVKVGQQFDLSLYVQDLRDDGEYVDTHGLTQPLVRGVFAAYVAFNFGPNVAKPSIPEVQSLFFPGITGSLRVLSGKSASRITSYDFRTAASSALSAQSIQAAINSMNSMIGPNATRVTIAGGYTRRILNVTFVGSVNVDEPLLKTSDPEVKVVEVVKGGAGPLSNAVTWSPDYPNGKVSQLGLTGTRMTIGGFSGSFTGLGTEERLVASVRMIAMTPGKSDFSPTVQGLSLPAQSTLVYGNLLAQPVPEESDVSPDDIEVAGCTVEVVA